MNGRLTIRSIASKKDKGRYPDGGGLYLQVGPTGRKAWIFRYQIKGQNENGKLKRREMGLGSADIVSLKDARKLSAQHRQTLSDGKDPKLSRDAERQKKQKNQVWTFDRCAEAYIKAHAPGWKNKKHAQQWRNTLKQYASPIFGNLPVEDITLALVLDVIEPIWQTKTETASRVRGRIERILSWAIVKGYRSQPNPALWRGNLKELLPEPQKVTKTIHHAALPYAEIGIFIQSLDRYTSMNANALRFAILTACRTNEVLAASWNEIDTRDRIWTIPANRMKSERDHRVPLSNQAIELLKNLPRTNGWIFPSIILGKHLSNMAMLTLLKKQLNRSDITVHGFRSTFRDWAAEETNHPSRLAEAALAHVLGDKTEAAYQRGDLLKKRAELMQNWADYIDQHLENVIPIKRQKQV